MNDTKPRRYWIRRGTAEWTYETYDDNDNPIIRLADSYYDSVSLVPAVNGIEVIEASTYDALEAELAALKKQIDEAPEAFGYIHIAGRWIFGTTRRSGDTYRAKMIVVEKL